MLFGFTGASGTGKTTLARMTADDLGITYHSASITETGRKHGFNPVGFMAIQDRLEMQKKLLADHIEAITAAERPLVVDRTPLDMAAYMLAEVGMYSDKTLSAEFLKEVDEYAALCVSVTQRLYDTVFFVGQLPDYEESETRPPLNRAYQTHTQMIMQGFALVIHGATNYMALRSPDLEWRRDTVHDYIVQRLDAIAHQRNSTAHVH